MNELNPDLNMTAHPAFTMTSLQNMHDDRWCHLMRVTGVIELENDRCDLRPWTLCQMTLTTLVLYDVVTAPLCLEYTHGCDARMWWSQYHLLGFRVYRQLRSSDAHLWWSQMIGLASNACKAIFTDFLNILTNRCSHRLAVYGDYAAMVICSLECC